MNPEAVLQKIQSKWGNKIVSTQKGIDCPEIRIKKEDIPDFMRFIESDEDLLFKLITDVTAVDFPERTPRFDIVYHVFSIKDNERLRIKAGVEDGQSVDSVTSVWMGAEWLERETFDMFGIGFKGHPDLRRILMEEDYKYNPLRKDFPLKGYEES